MPHLEHPTASMGGLPINICLLTVGDIITMNFQGKLFLKRFVNISGVKLVTTEFFSEGLKKQEQNLSFLLNLTHKWWEDKFSLLNTLMLKYWIPEAQFLFTKIFFPSFLKILLDKNGQWTKVHCLCSYLLGP